MMKNNQEPSKAKLKYEQILADLRNPVKKAVRTRKVTEKLGGLFRAIILIGLSFVIIFPIFQQITLAFRDPIDVQNPLVIWIPEKWSIINFKISIKILNYWVSLWNNIRVSVVCMVGQVFCSVLAGYALSRLKFKGSNVIFWIVMLTLLIPPQTVALSRALYFSR